jgi:hypothetical protein
MCVLMRCIDADTPQSVDVTAGRYEIKKSTPDGSAGGSGAGVRSEGVQVLVRGLFTRAGHARRAGELGI